jgi:tetratricopeptide (TPR) repeat protein
MSMVLAAALALAQVAPSAWSSARPPECGADAERAANVWERAKSPDLRRYCDLLASGASKLASGSATSARDVIAIAAEADKLVTGKAAPRVLEGRALAAMGRDADALGALRDAKSRDDRALDDPPALLAWARVLARTGSVDDARAAYGELLPRAASLPVAERVSAAIESGLLSLARSREGAREAVAALREAVREAQDAAQPLAALALALALSRDGEEEEARALLQERIHGDPRNALESVRAKTVLARTASTEAQAMAAFALEASDPAGAHDAWQAYLEASPQGPWAADARARLAKLAGPKRAPLRALKTNAGAGR